MPLALNSPLPPAATREEDEDQRVPAAAPSSGRLSEPGSREERVLMPRPLRTRRRQCHDR